MASDPHTSCLRTPTVVEMLFCTVHIHIIHEPTKQTPLQLRPQPNTPSFRSGQAPLTRPLNQQLYQNRDFRVSSYRIRAAVH